MTAYTFTITKQEFDELRANVARDLNECYEFPEGTFEQEAFLTQAMKNYFDNAFEKVFEDAWEGMVEGGLRAGDLFHKEIEKNLARQHA